MSSSWARIIAVRTPRRRCVGSTPTTVTPADFTVPPPGTERSNGNTPAPPTTRPFSRAAWRRSTAVHPTNRSTSSGAFSTPK
jgi:hypothetical protein